MNKEPGTYICTYHTMLYHVRKKNGGYDEENIYIYIYI